MPAKSKNLSVLEDEKFPNAAKYKIGIVVSAYHQHITFALRDACIATLKKYGVNEKHIYVRLSPGAYELPLAASWLYEKSKADAIICLGCVIKGDTDHDIYINNAVSQALMNLSLQTKGPFIFGLLTPNTEQQAKDRAGGKYGNKGDECAMAALKMLALKGNIKKEEMKLHTIDTGFFKLDGGAMFGVVPKTLWQKLNPPDANNLCTWAMRCMLIEDGKQLILIDCGLGNKQDEKFFSHYEPHGDASLEKSIHGLGFRPEDITDVILTHLHFDHCGGAIKKDSGGVLSPAFKNATYWSNEKHWQWATKPNAREKASFLKENILPIQESGQLKFVADESTEVNPNIHLKTVSGHTESMFIPHITANGKTILYCADLFPSMAHVPIPYVMAYDTRPLLTLDEKVKFLEEAIKGNYYLFFEHDRSIECCDLRATEKGVKAGQQFKLSELF